MPGLKLDKKLLEKSPLFKWLFLSLPLAIFPNGNGKVQGNTPVFFKSDYGGISNKTEFELELWGNLGLHLSRESASLWSLHPASSWVWSCLQKLSKHRVVMFSLRFIQHSTRLPTSSINLRSRFETTSNWMSDASVAWQPGGRVCSYLNADWEQTGFQFMLLKVQTYSLKWTGFLLSSSSFQSSGKP